MTRRSFQELAGLFLPQHEHQRIASLLGGSQEIARGRLRRTGLQEICVADHGPQKFGEWSERWAQP